MTLTKLVIYIAVIALLLTLVTGWLKRPDSGRGHWLMTWLQHFTGALFVFSGLVKGVDPMGTAFKMEQYFAEFQATFAGTWFSFAAPLFPWLAGYAAAFAIFMILLEIIVGLALILGHRPKLTSWVFLAVLVFFTLLTGFTYLTGYVPMHENFFAFSKWTAFDANNMRVTDCGCFGDFLPLVPRTSFLKDVVLLIPAIYFVTRHRRMHQLFTGRIRTVILGAAALVLLVYCLRYAFWREPHVDFRPFKAGVNVAERKAAEQDAEAAVQIVSWKLRNNADSRIVVLPHTQYMQELASYPRDEWTVEDTEMTEPEVPRTKISDFVILSSEGEMVTDEILESNEPLLIVLCYKLAGQTTYAQEMVTDTLYRTDTLVTEGAVTLMRVPDRTETRSVQRAHYDWSPRYLQRFINQIHPLTDAAESAGIRVLGSAGAAGEDMINDFRRVAGADYPFYEADDILLKTIMRSNPGVLLMQDGVILGKWHYRNLPDIETVRGLIH